jgi:uncharacterized protein GlcG (DUF336 family)
MLGTSVMMGSQALAQQQPAQLPPPPAPPGPNITLEQAQKVVAAAVAEGNKLPYKLVIAILGSDGQLVYFVRQDGAPLASVGIAQGKARTAATYGRSSKVFFDLMEAGRTYLATLDPNLVASPGGEPIVVGGKLIGAIGVSGGPTGAQDLGAALAGANALK